jgi:hypothetical protein
LNSTRKKDFGQLIDITKEFPNLEDWTATVRAMYLLYDIYEFNLTEANRGNIVFQVTKLHLTMLFSSFSLVDNYFDFCKQSLTFVLHSPTHPGSRLF